MIRESRRFNVATCGRRFGKTTLGENRVIRHVLEGKPAAWFSPSYKMLTEVWRDVRQVLAPVTVAVDKQQHRIELVTGGVLEMWSLDTANAPRGRRYAVAVVDEAGFVPDLEYAWNAVIRPTLMDYQGGAWFLGTPRGRNYFWQLWQRGAGSGEPEWVSWQMPTTANPYIDPAEIEAARLDVPERTYQQEILAAFLEDGGGVFRRVREAIGATQQHEAQDGHQYAFGVDWGKSHDWTVITVLDLMTREVVALDRFNQIDWSLQRGRLLALHERFRPVTVIAEWNSIGDPNIEELRRAGIYVVPWNMTNETKKAAVEALALALEQGAVRLPDDQTLIGELQAFEMERLPSGRWRYAAPPGMHDDCVVSLALAWQAAASPPAAAAETQPERGWADERPRVRLLR